MEGTHKTSENRKNLLYRKDETNIKQCCSKNLQNGKNIAFVMLFCKNFQPRETKSELRCIDEEMKKVCEK